jgi:hypothetical protein
MNPSHRRLVRIAATAVCALSGAGGVLAAQASAATLAANSACYVNANPFSGTEMTITGAGFVPGASASLQGGTAFADATADASGNLVFQTPAPTLKSSAPGSAKTVLTVIADNPDGSQTTAAVTVTSANLSIQTKPTQVKHVNKDKVTFSFSGFTPGKHIYGYYQRKKVVAKAKFGVAKGPCGLLKQKALLYPGGHPKNDQYKVTFESSSRFVKKTFPEITGTLSIFKLP